MKICCLSNFIPEELCFIELPGRLFLFCRGSNYTAYPENKFASYIHLKPWESMSSWSGNGEDLWHFIMVVRGSFWCLLNHWSVYIVLISRESAPDCWPRRCRDMVLWEDQGFLPEEHALEATEGVLHILHPPTLTVPPGPWPVSQKQWHRAFCLQSAPTMSLWLVDALVLQWKAKWAWKETMTLTLEDFMFSTSLSHQWIYEPGEEFPEMKEEEKLVKTIRFQIWTHSPIFPYLIFHLVNFSRVLFFTFQLVFRAIWVLFWLGSDLSN